MRVSRSGDLFIATRITGPSHNFLGLDFRSEFENYSKDFAESDPSPKMADSVRRQVLSAIDEANMAAHELIGIQFDSTDTPSDLSLIHI